MRRSKLPLVLVLVFLVSALGIVPLLAAIKATTLKELLDISTGVVCGEITKKEIVRFDWGDDRDVTHTILTIKGEDLLTGEPVTREVYYMGGIWRGQLDSPNTAPKEHQTRIGATVVAFYWFDDDLVPGGANRIFNFANLNQVQRGIGSPTVIGNGEGAAVPYNIKLTGLRLEIQSLWSEIQEQRASGRK